MPRKIRSLRDLLREERGDIPVGTVLLVALVVLPLVLALSALKMEALVTFMGKYADVIDPPAVVTGKIE